MANPNGLRYLSGGKSLVVGSGGGVEFKESKIPFVFFSPSNKQGYHHRHHHCHQLYKRDNLGVPET
jgi:hypothetical protein